MSTLRITVGCYEQAVVGYELNVVAARSLSEDEEISDEEFQDDLKKRKVEQEEGEDEEAEEDFIGSLERIFSISTHQGPVKCLDASSKWFVSTGADDSIQIYFKNTMAEKDFLQDFAISYQTQKVNTQGSLSVSVVAFIDDTTMITGTENGNLFVWQFLRKSWELQIVLRSASRGAAHASTIVGLAIDPKCPQSLVSISKDKTLKLWDLVKGKAVYSKTFDFVPEGFHFKEDGSSYAVYGGQDLLLISASNDKKVTTFKHKDKIKKFCWISPTVFATGVESHEIYFWDITKPETQPLSILNFHEARIKGLSVCHLYDTQWLVSASADGVICVWNIADLSDPVLFAQKNTRLRITCMKSVTMDKNYQDSLKREIKPEIKQEILDDENEKDEKVDINDNNDLKENETVKEKAVVPQKVQKNVTFQEVAPEPEKKKKAKAKVTVTLLN